MSGGLERGDAGGNPKSRLIAVRWGIGEAAAVYRVNPDELAAQIALRNSNIAQAIDYDAARQPGARHRIGAGIGDLPFADVAVPIAQRHLEETRSGAISANRTRLKSATTSGVM